MSRSRFMPETMTDRAEDWYLELKQCKILRNFKCKKKQIQNVSPNNVHVCIPNRDLLFKG